MITKCLIGFAVWVGVVGSGFSDTVYFVSKDGSNQYPYDSLETAATELETILSSIYFWSNDTIMVDSGTYIITTVCTTVRPAIKAINGFTDTFIDCNQLSIALVLYQDSLVDGFSFINGQTAILNQGGTIQNCAFFDNTVYLATTRYIIDNWSGSINNCLFFNNTIGQDSYCIDNYEGDVVNCTFWDNEIDGSAIYNYQDGVVDNSIFFSNNGIGSTDPNIINVGTVRNICSPSLGVYDIGSNENWITNDPLLEVTYETISFRGMKGSVQIPIVSLHSNSPCIDTGDSDLWDDESSDIYGNSRKIGKSVDMGAVEIGESDTFNFGIIETANGLFLTWRNLKRNSAQYYEIYRSENEDFSNAELAGTTYETYFEDLDKNLKNRVKYYYYVVEKKHDKADKVSKGKSKSKTKKATKNDFSGEGKSQLTIYNEDDGMWYIKTESSVQIVSLGGNGFQPVVGDFEGNKVSTPAVYSEETGYWYIQNESGTINSCQFGGPGYVPVSMDVTGDGQNDVIVYDTNSGYWFFLNNGIISYLKFGNSSCIPVPADYNGSGKDNISVYDQENGMWYIFLDNDDGSFELAYVQFGGPGYVPVPFDFNGNGISCLGLYHESSGYWFILDGTQVLYMQFGGPGYEAITGYFDGTSNENFGVYHRDSGYWHLLDSNCNYSYQKFGNFSCIPVQ